MQDRRKPPFSESIRSFQSAVAAVQMKNPGQQHPLSALRTWKSLTFLPGIDLPREQRRKTPGLLITHSYRSCNLSSLIKPVRYMQGWHQEGRFQRRQRGEHLLRLL